MKTTSFQINYNSTIELRITFGFPIVNPNKNRLLLITLLLTTFHLVPATTEPFIAADNQLCPLLISVGVLCCAVSHRARNVSRSRTSLNLWPKRPYSNAVNKGQSFDKEFSFIITFSIILLITRLQAI
jgi:hypothetical protein